MRPAGGIFPFDIRRGRLVLSWRGGPEAWVYRELAAAGDEAGEKAALRRPGLFDWPRFRELWEGETLPKEVRDDPWTVDWSAFSLKVLQSGFDRRYIKAEERRELPVPGLGGPWARSSPFGGLLSPDTGGLLRLPVGNRAETFVSREGILRAGGNSWLWLPY
jgi:hypothetical protein